MKRIDFKNKRTIALLALFGVSLISAGVFASASITLNSGNAVNLGAGAVAVNVCDQQATISATQNYNMSLERFELTTISLQGLNHVACNGKTIYLAMKDGSTLHWTTWGIASANDGQDLIWGGSAGTGLIGSQRLEPINTAASNISTIAISAQ